MGSEKAAAAEASLCCPHQHQRGEATRGAAVARSACGSCGGCPEAASCWAAFDGSLPVCVFVLQRLSWVPSNSFHEMLTHLQQTAQKTHSQKRQRSSIFLLSLHLFSRLFVLADEWFGCVCSTTGMANLPFYWWPVSECPGLIYENVLYFAPCFDVALLGLHANCSRTVTLIHSNSEGLAGNWMSS